jgi:glyoxylase-like metal-dependent hydrolase (beta-lactamase superfamily II)
LRRLHSPNKTFPRCEIKVVPVSKNIYMLEGSGGNIGVSVGDDGILIVDDQYAPLAEKIEAALQKLNPGKLKFVLNTHHHGDHTGGNAAFGAKDATIVAQSNVASACPAARIQRRRHCPSSLSTTLPRFISTARKSSCSTTGRATLMATALFTSPAQTLFTWAISFSTAAFPFIDLNSGGSVEGYIKTVAAVLEKIPPDAKVIPGHGKLATVEDLRHFMPCLLRRAAS